MTHHPAAPARTHPGRPSDRRTGLLGFRVLVGGVLATGSLVTGIANAPGAAAATGTAPVTTPDQITLVAGAGGAALVDVLKNDTDADGDALQVCRLGEIPEQLYVEQVPQSTVTTDHATSVAVVHTSGTTSHQAGRTKDRDAQLFISSNGKPGTYTLTYYACDFSYLTPGTVTVTVEEAPKVKVKVTKLDDRPGHLRITNTSGFPVRFAWGSYTANKADGTVTVTRRPVVVAVNRPSIFWAAYNRHTASFGYGTVRGIRLPAGAQHLPAGLPAGPLPGLNRAQIDRVALRFGTPG